MRQCEQTRSRIQIPDHWLRHVAKPTAHQPQHITGQQPGRLTMHLPEAGGIDHKSERYPADLHQFVHLVSTGEHRTVGQ